MPKILKKKNFIMIPAFAVTDLHLKGNELLIYSLIFGFCQDENSEFTGSLEYMQAWINCTKQCVLKVLASLVNKGLVMKFKDGNRVSYRTTEIKESDEELETSDEEGQKSLPEGSKKFTGRVNRVYRKGKKSLHNNIDIAYDNISISSACQNEENQERELMSAECQPDRDEFGNDEFSDSSFDSLFPKKNEKETKKINFSKIRKTNDYLSRYFGKVTPENKSIAEAIVKSVEDRNRSVAPNFHFTPNQEANEEHALLEYSRKNGISMSEIQSVIHAALKDSWWGSKIDSSRFITNNYIKLASKFKASHAVEIRKGQTAFTDHERDYSNDEGGF